jgi:hypothetical protein
MRLALWFTPFAIAIACSATTPTPNGTVVGSWQAATSKWPELAAAAPNASGAERTLGFAQHGVKVDVRFKTGVVDIKGESLKMPLEVNVKVIDNKGFAISGSFLDPPIHYAGMPEDLRALDFTAQLSSGTRSCGGTRYENDRLTVRVFGDGSAKLVPD